MAWTVEGVLHFLSKNVRINLGRVIFTIKNEKNQKFLRKKRSLIAIFNR